MSAGADISRVIGDTAGWPTRDDVLLADTVANVLGLGWTVERDVVLGDDRVAVMVDGVAVHVTTGRRVERGQVLQMLQRLATHDAVTELVLVTTRTAHCTLPLSVGAKPLHIQRITR